MTRPTFREIFVRPPKRLEVSFYTSSTEKFLQARLVLNEFGVNLGHFRSSQEPYHEDYELGQTRLLERAIQEVKHRLGVNSLFFVEDTTLRINALSTEEFDFPGLKVKEWFTETSFDQLDKILRDRGNDRSAKVSSDIALHVPGLGRPVFVHGHTSGQVADSAPRFRKSVQHPWLSPSNFNGWFIPEGATKPLGEMSFEESVGYDFRVRSLASLVERLEEYAAILNLPGSSYTIRRARPEPPSLRLFREDLPIYVVVGKVCAGKTTFGQYASGRGEYLFVEASSVVRTIAKEQAIEAPTPFYLAKEVLRLKGPDIVARSILGMYGEDLEAGAIISGFRTIEEVEFLRRELPECKVVLVEASERTRFERHLRRGRLGGVTTIDEFHKLDSNQWSFGLLAVAAELADVVVENEGSMDDFHDQIDAVLSGEYDRAKGVSAGRRTSTAIMATRAFRCLEALAKFEEPATCAEIAGETVSGIGRGVDEGAERISSRHVNWVLKDIPQLARRVDAKGDLIRYEILPAGRAYLKAVRALEDMRR